MTKHDQTTIDELIAFATGKYPQGREIPGSWQSVIPLLKAAPQLRDTLETIIDREAIVKRFGNDGPWQEARALLAETQPRKPV